MSGKLTKDKINARIADRGFVLAGEYSGVHTKTLFLCVEGHEWVAMPSNVMRGRDCPQCTSLSKDVVNERIANRGIFMVGDYQGTQKNSVFRCLKGHQWIARLNSVMSGRGCPQCKSLSKDVVNERIANRGIFMVGEFKTVGKKTAFRCAEGHEWNATPNSIMSGCGCPRCAKYGFNPANPANLYYIRVESELGTFWKIGITNYDATKRFNSENTTIRVLREWRYEVGQEAYDAEQAILLEFNHLRYCGPKLLNSGGDTEMFLFDVLQLDHRIAS